MIARQGYTGARSEAVIRVDSRRIATTPSSSWWTWLSLEAGTSTIDVNVFGYPNTTASFLFRESLRYLNSYEPF
jgi:hypothetical protein